MHRQLRAGRRVCRRELLEASAQPTAFSPGRAKGAVIVVGCFYRGLRQRGCRAGDASFELLEGHHGHGRDGDARHDLSNKLRLPP
eukprot:scaffold12720_cov61-Phaeocystis_antarctica.AAC.1